MRRFAGGFLIAHAIGHAYVGTWALNQRATWLAMLLWSVAVIGYCAGGLGLLRVPVLRKGWLALTSTASVASIALCVWSSAWWVVPGLVIDAAILVFVVGARSRRFESEIETVSAAGASFRHPTMIRIGWAIGVVALAYVAVVALMRPVALRWGTSAAERDAALPGDGVFPGFTNYRIDHAITIHAPPSAIWPWLMQLGQDRGGFYSYDWLERGFGADIRNADRVHPEWQSRSVGDTIFATQRSYFGGRLGALGWRVNALERDRVIGLENWGTFVLNPIDSTATRLIVRTRGNAPPGVRSFMFAPVDVFLFEPAHFIMERAMLRGVRDRVERASRVRAGD
jgi:hypothetical protein